MIRGEVQHRMLIASRNVNRRSIVNLYCSLEKERERESKKRGDLITEWRASIILPMALRGNEY